MNELTAFIAFTAVVISLTIFDSMHDALVVSEIRKYMKLRPDHAYPTRDNTWKLVGNVVALGWISFFTLFNGFYFSNWYILFWLPIFYLTWWITHDFFTGWFILGKPLHISSDPISQFFGRMCQQWGWLYLGMRLIWLFLLVMAYLMLSFNIRLG